MPPGETPLVFYVVRVGLALYAFQCRFHATRAFISGQETLAAGNRKQATAKATVQLAKARFLPETRCSSVKV